jgi:DNA-directed RNA polymerase specialized sigma24 family protein
MSLQAKIPYQPALLAEIPHLRAYARLMTTDVQSADDGVMVCLEQVSSLIDELGSYFPRIWPLKLLSTYILANERANSRDPVPCTVSSWADAQKQELHQTLTILSANERAAVILVSCNRYLPIELSVVCNCTHAEVRQRFRKGMMQLAKVIYSGSHFEGLAQPGNLDHRIRKSLI